MAQTVALLSSSSFCIFNYREALIREMVRRGYRVLALAPHDPAGRERLREAGAEPIDIPMAQTGTNPVTDLRNLIAMVRVLRAHRPDIVMPSFTKPVIWGSIAARLAGVRRIIPMVSGMGYVFTGNQGFKQWVLRIVTSALYRIALAGTERVLFENSDDVAEFSRRGLISDGKAVVLDGAGVDIERFAPAPLSKEPRFLFVGRMLREKGIRELIEASRIVRREFPQAVVTLLGGADVNPGSYTVAELRSMAANGDINWIDQVADVRPYIAAANVFVLPSYREGLPRSTLEAMAMGRPIITTDAIGCRETIGAGNGIMVPVGDANALADAMLAFCRNPSHIAQMGAQSRSLVERRFASARINARVMEVLDHSHRKLTPDSETPLAPDAPYIRTLPFAPTRT